MPQVPARPDPDRFSTEIDNPYLPLRPGTTYVYETPEKGERVTFEVTDRTRVVDGVTTVVVHDTAYINGLVVEDTFDWFAQDDQGNVWYFGEETAEFEPGNPVPDNTDGSWEAGIDGAEAGIVMLADPQPGDAYAQESAPGIAEDRAEVLSLTGAAVVRYGTFEDVLVTRDINPLDPSEETKFYAAGVGTLLATSEDGDREQLVEIIVRGGAGGDRLTGYAGGDSLLGFGGDDRLFGLGGNDMLKGGRGEDKLVGGAGFDRLEGGLGDGLLKGGRDGDTFVFGRLSDGRVEVDTIADYRKAELDVIDLPGSGAAVVDETAFSGGWQLTLAGDGDVIRLLGIEDRNGDGSITDQLLFL